MVQYIVLMVCACTAVVNFTWIIFALLATLGKCLKHNLHTLHWLIPCWNFLSITVSYVFINTVNNLEYCFLFERMKLKILWWVLCWRQLMGEVSCVRSNASHYSLYIPLVPSVVINLIDGDISNIPSLFPLSSPCSIHSRVFILCLCDLMLVWPHK